MASTPDLGFDREVINPEVIYILHHSSMNQFCLSIDCVEGMFNLWIWQHWSVTYSVLLINCIHNQVSCL